jgi:hypothetical protein
MATLDAGSNSHAFFIWGHLKYDIYAAPLRIIEVLVACPLPSVTAVVPTSEDVFERMPWGALPSTRLMHGARFDYPLQVQGAHSLII